MKPATSPRIGPSTKPVDPRFADHRATGDRALRNALVEDHRWLVAHCVRRFKNKGEPTDDLEQVGMVALIKAVDRFDPAYGNTFPTFAVPTIVGELRRHFRDKTWSMQVSRRIKDNYVTIKTVVDELQATLGRSPTIHEIAQRADLSIEDTIAAHDAGASSWPMSLASTSPGDDNEPGAEPHYLGVDEPGYARVEARVTFPDLIAALPGERERQIVKLRFVDNMTQSQIAAVFGISQVHVSRMLRSSLKLMRRRLTASRPRPGEARQAVTRVTNLPTEHT